MKINPLSNCRYGCFLARLSASVLLLVLLTTVLHAQQANSTKKIRVQPNQLSKKIGSAVNWKTDLDAAIAESKRSGKPIFWYVPTLPDTFMDRKIEIHRYMLAGPFSWPAIIKTLNENAVCLKTPPTRRQQKSYGLQTYEFVEPGFVILKPDGTKQSQVDMLTTLQPVWINELIQQSLGLSARVPLYSQGAQAAWKLLAEQDFEGAAARTKLDLAKADVADAERVELELISGMAAFRTGDHQQALNIWKAASERYPNEPLAWKASAEAQLIGPFARGFETHRKLPAQVMTAGIESRGSAAPKNVYTQQQLQSRSTQFLLAMQRSDGGFRDCDYDYGGTDSLGNVHVAVSSLAGLALLGRHDRLVDGSPELKKRLVSSVSAAAKFVSDENNLNKQDRDEILWACAFRLRFLLACERSVDPQIQAVASPAQIARMVESLEAIQSKRGNWYHEYSNPFVTATALLALEEAARAQHSVDSKKFAKGAESLAGDRYQNGAFPYISAGRKRANNPSRDAKRSLQIGSAGRRPLCELALFQCKKSSDQQLVAAVKASFEHHKALAKAYKYDNHTNNYVYGGFFFWYDMRSRCEAIKFVADEEQRAKFVAQQKALMMGLPEVDGCFVDSHELGRVYGTAMALICFDLLESN